MKVSNLLIAGLLTFSSISQACNKPVSYLKIGEPAKCTGYLFSPEKEKEVRELTEKYPVLVELNNKQALLINKLNEQVDLNQQISSNLRKQIENVETDNRIEKIIYFTLGLAVGLTVTKINK